jgi:uncharacterized protein
VVKAGQIVKVQVLNADPKTKRIGLSMKALAGPPPAPRPVERRAKPDADTQLAALANKWKVR